MSLLLDLKAQDTICAPATPSGRSALCLIRVSGPNAPQICKQVFRPKRGIHNPFKATLGDIVDDDITIDEVVCTFFPDHRSFTGEPSFEISAHGNPLILKSILSLLYKRGCRPAGPGEFSMRAVIHGKLDLAKAESIADLIEASSPQGVQFSLRNLKGGLEEVLLPVRESLVSILCEIEARLDFPDEGLSEKHRERLLGDLNDAHRLLQDLLERSRQSAKLMRGVRIVLFGKPNAGKSTLLNALVQEERSIVHESAGTTRDVLEVPWQIKDMPVVLVDVAGIRDEHDIHPVEAIGIDRAKKELERADLILHLIDSENSSSKEQDTFSRDSIKVFTKCDLHNTACQINGGVAISAKYRQGLDVLLEKMASALYHDLPDSTDVLLTRLRHIEKVSCAADSISLAIHALESNQHDECVAYDLREAGAALDELFGTQINEDILNLIFTRFCIGK